jgi:hypothetical protein
MDAALGSKGDAHDEADIAALQQGAPSTADPIQADPGPVRAGMKIPGEDP